MKAIIYENYGEPDVLKMKEVDKPKLKDNELLVKVMASSVTSGAVIIRRGKHPDSKFFTFALRVMFGLRKPKNQILGFEFAGIVEQIGKSVTRFKPGDKVFGTTTGLKQGAYAEYLCLPETWKHGVVDIMPDKLTFEQAASVPIGSMTALQLLNKSGIGKAQKILIYGASGSVGTYTVQLAKHYGAEVTAVCSGSNFDLVKSIGADNVIDYTKEDFAVSNEKYDLIFDAVGKIKKSDCKNIIKNNGIYISVKSMTSEKLEDLLLIKRLISEGKIKPIIDKIYSWEDIVQAHKYVDSGRKKGNVVIKISD